MHKNDCKLLNEIKQKAPIDYESLKNPKNIENYYMELNNEGKVLTKKGLKLTDIIDLNNIVDLIREKCEKQVKDQKIYLLNDAYQYPFDKNDISKDTINRANVLLWSKLDNYCGINNSCPELSPQLYDELSEVLLYVYEYTIFEKTRLAIEYMLFHLNELLNIGFETIIEITLEVIKNATYTLADLIKEDFKRIDISDVPVYTNELKKRIIKTFDKKIGNMVVNKKGRKILPVSHWKESAITIQALEYRIYLPQIDEIKRDYHNCKTDRKVKNWEKSLDDDHKKYIATWKKMI